MVGYNQYNIVRIWCMWDNMCKSTCCFKLTSDQIQTMSIFWGLEGEKLGFTGACKKSGGLLFELNSSKQKIIKGEGIQDDKRQSEVSIQSPPAALTYNITRKRLSILANNRLILPPSSCCWRSASKKALGKQLMELRL